MTTNIKDYLENYLKAKLENEYFSPEELEQYRNAYFNKEDELDNQKEEKEISQVEQVKIGTDEEKERVLEEVLREYLV